ncbi:winged helix-turn-helix domain-containing protein [Actinoplanes sp. TRM 88003]|uniref:Winged helix-turn-helix domain-containing protein n=1 Tax=Paractinoplanes aksuensis TaxID=2939490 RepID=A0ABT1DLH8_9ACTN|nr:winged helix-turn-helix domain-containing protein [Actinoplanes aksuensis]MCO8271697.1 winged helix-turn-helix domain-containing protein [Actinoplanes aksuensis]
MTDSVVIGIASSADGRRRLAQMLGDSETILIVSTPDQARQFLDVVAPLGGEVPEGLRVDSDRRVLCWLDQEVALTPLEHDFLRCLVTAPGRVWTYEKLHLAVWGNDHVGRGSDIHSMVRRVRAKLARLGAAATIHAIRGVGIRFTA